MAARRAARDDAREAPQIEAREQAAAALDLGGRKDCASSRRFERGSAASWRGLVRARVWLHDLALLAQPSAVAASDPDQCPVDATGSQCHTNTEQKPTGKVA